MADFKTAPADAPVGIGLAVWTNQQTMTNLLSGVPVRLSRSESVSVPRSRVLRRPRQ